MGYLRTYLALGLLTMVCAGCIIEDKPPHSLNDLKHSSSLAVAETQRCADGVFSGHSWKADYCAEVRIAMGRHFQAKNVNVKDQLIREASVL